MVDIGKNNFEYYRMYYRDDVGIVGCWIRDDGGPMIFMAIIN